MTNLNDVLLAMSNIPVVDPIAEIWGRGLQGGRYTVIEYTGALPITINANGEPLIDYRIYGNTEQTSGTTTYPIVSVTVQALESGTNYAMFNLADFPNVVAGDKITVNVGGTNYTLAVKKVDSTYVYVENREV